MFDVNKIRKDFPMLNKQIHGKKVIYLDNAATTLKPQSVIDAVSYYYTDLGANAHRGDYDLSHDVDVCYEDARKKVAKFINADYKEVFFTSGASMSLNSVVYGISEQYLKEDDEVLITQAEHASNVLPWFKMQQEKKISIGYIPLDEEGRLTVENVKKAITSKTKVISVAHVTNVLGYCADIKAICEVAHQHNILVVVDGAQSVPHLKVDVKDLDCDFLCFSGHKMCGPTGIGVVYGKYALLEKLPPLMMGGGMNSRFDTCGDYMLVKPPHKFEAGTPHIEGAIGLGAAVDYLMNLGMENIQQYEKELHDYAIKKMKEIDGVKIYNEHGDTGVITFNYKDVFAQDIASHLNKYGVCVRAGQHCAKILMDYLGTTATVRMSTYFYNTYEEVDAFVEALKKGDDYLDAFFG